MPPPLVSFVIATYNRGPVVLDCLRRVLACGLSPAQMEILVVDNASTDGTADLIHRELGDSVKLLRLPQNCGPVAKNVALRRARGEFVVLLDDDAYPEPGATMQMVRHFRADPHLGAAVFDVALPDGSKEGSAYPDVFIGAGTGLRRKVLETAGLLPADFFMQAEEYDLSFRIWAAGYSVQRFWDMPLTHLKSPGARISQRTTRLDVRNNLWVLARYVPAPLCHELAADWLTRYWSMAIVRDTQQPPHPAEGTHKQAFIRGAAEGLAKWTIKRQGERHIVSAEVIEQVFKFAAIRRRLQQAKDRLGLQRIAFTEFGKNMLAYWKAARELDLTIVGIVDANASPASPAPNLSREYRGTPLLSEAHLRTIPEQVDALIVSNMSRAHAPRRAEAWRRVVNIPVVDLFGHGEIARSAADRLAVAMHI